MKIVELYADRMITAYQDADLDSSFHEKVDICRESWKERCKEYVAEHGDEGSCVMGAGFFIYYLPKRAKTPRKKMLISAHSVSAAQGSVTWEHSVPQITKMFNTFGINVEYEYGNMD